MTTSEHLQFLALMIPTILVLAAAAISLAHPDVDVLSQPAVQYAVAANFRAAEDAAE